MIEEQILISFIDTFLDRLESELDYELYEDKDRKKCLYLDGKIAGVKELRREWLKHGRTT